ncbi:BatA domain-containing protein, partial [Massilia sp. 2TAF26]|uniref:BatA domain-containing protein n=2 Tax=Telluria group TaxID=2895353 RepID=UPI003F9947E9
MASLQPLWWFALPVLLLPIWWHMQKRERVKTELLATARFLPAAAPQQQRVPRWIELLLLVLRLLLLITLIAWLAVTTIPWRGDTVLIEAPLESSEPAWVVQQVAAAGMTQAARLPLPADALSWL